MDQKTALDLIERQLSRLDTAINAGRTSAEAAAWRQTTSFILNEIFGPSHGIVQNFLNVDFGLLGTDTFSALDIAGEIERRLDDRFLDGMERIRGYLGSANEIVQDFGPPAAEAEATMGVVDEELWNHVATVVASEHWEQVASQTAIFVESRIRQWAALGPKDIGRDLMNQVFGSKTGIFPLGKTQSERLGWHQLALGVVGALGNVDRHRIQTRNDARLYATGVLGVGSLLLTQLKYEHGNRFRSGSDPEPDDSTDGVLSTE